MLKRKREFEEEVTGEMEWGEKKESCFQRSKITLRSLVRAQGEGREGGMMAMLEGWMEDFKGKWERRA